jgi:hypothetical protein
MDHLLYGIQYHVLAGAVSFQQYAGGLVVRGELVDAAGYDLLLFHHLLFVAEVPLQGTLYPDDIAVDALFHSIHIGFPGL